MDTTQTAMFKLGGFFDTLDLLSLSKKISKNGSIVFDHISAKMSKAGPIIRKKRVEVIFRILATPSF